MADKNSKIIAKPVNRKEIVSTPEQKKRPEKPYHYTQVEEPESFSISSYARGRISSTQE